MRKVAILVGGLLVIISGFTWIIWEAYFRAGFEKSGHFYLSQYSDLGVEAVTKELVSEGYIKNSGGFIQATRLKRIQKFKPGRYWFEKGQSQWQGINALRSGAQTPVNVVINACSGVERLAAVLGNQLDVDSTEWYRFFMSEENIKACQSTKEAWTYLITPNTYSFYWTVSPEDFMKRMREEHEAFWSKQTEALSKTGLTRLQVVTLASIVEKETNKAAEMPKVAGLYLNRLKKNWKLESDPTALKGVQKAFPDSVVKRVLRKHIEFPSPYNTYLNTGLPPGPISIPSIQSIKAVLEPEMHDYFFMVASVDRPGYHEFSRANEYSRHSGLANRYRQFLQENRIR